MKKFIKILLLCAFIAAVAAALTVLASHSIYRADVRNCIHDGGSETYCEIKFK